MSRTPWAMAAFLAGAACSPAPPVTIEVTGTEYAFTVADTVPAGPVRIHYQGRGKVLHEMVLGRLREGVTPAEFADSLTHDRRVRPLLDGGTGVLFGAPGQTSYPLSLDLTLLAGRHYALWCQFRDGPDTPKHMTMGMFKLLVVR